MIYILFKKQYVSEKRICDYATFGIMVVQIGEIKNYMIQILSNYYFLNPFVKLLKNRNQNKWSINDCKSKQTIVKYFLNSFFFQK